MDSLDTLLYLLKYFLGVDSLFNLSLRRETIFMSVAFPPPHEINKLFCTTNCFIFESVCELCHYAIYHRINKDADRTSNSKINVFSE